MSRSSLSRVLTASLFLSTFAAPTLAASDLLILAQFGYDPGEAAMQEMNQRMAEACEGKAVNEACSYTMTGYDGTPATSNGTCQMDPPEWPAPAIMNCHAK